MKTATVESIEQAGDDGCWQASLTIGNHMNAVVVIGRDLTQCVERTYKVLEAFNNPHHLCSIMEQ